jgi:hypothetical protein
MVIFICKYVFKKYLKEYLLFVSIKRMLFVGVVLIMGWLTLSCINYLVEKKFILAKASHVFIMAHLDDTGILEKFMKEKCSDAQFSDCKLCAYRDSLPIELSEFMWPGRVLQNTGGWIGSKAEYEKIIKASLTEPKYLMLNLYKSFIYGMTQLANNDIGQGLSAYIMGSAPYGQMHWRFPNELNNYLNSRQNKWNGVNLKLSSLNLVHLFLLILSFFLILYIFTTSLWSKLEPKTVVLLVLILFSVFINSFVTAGLNAPCERFQARVVWMVPFSLILLVWINYKAVRNR